MQLIRNIILGGLILFFLSSLTRNFFEYLKNYQFYQEVKTEYEELNKKNTSLKTAQLKTRDPYELEKTIRNKLNLSKENETVIIIPEPTPTPIRITPTPLPNYQQWWNVFFQN